MEFFLTLLRIEINMNKGLYPKKKWINFDDMKILDDLVKDQINPQGYISCPYHEDKKMSMLIRNGIGHCFHCKVNMGAMKYLMDIKGHTFRDALKILGLDR